MIKLKKGIIMTITKQATFIYSKNGCVEQLKALLEAMVGLQKQKMELYFMIYFN